MKKYLFLSVLIIFSLVFINTNVNAATEFFSDSFGNTSLEDVPDWVDGGGDNDNDTYTTNGSGRPGSPTTQNARVRGGGHITKTISTVGYQNIVLKYYWMGDDDADGNSDNLKVYWKKTSDSTFILLNTHKLDGNESWSDQVSVSLGSGADDTSIDIRFLGDSNANDEEGRIDDVSLEGDVLTPPDTEAPVIETHSGITEEATSPSGAVVSYTAPNTTDNVDADAPAICLPASGSLFALGSTLVTCNKTDSSGNEATPVTFNIIVEDTTAPVITLIGNAEITMYLNETYTEQGATASDIVDGDTSAVVGGDIVNTSMLGTYVVTYNKIDANGNEADEVTRTVNVLDEDAPYINTGEITNPTLDQEVSGTIELTAVYDDGDDINDDNVQWAVRENSCSTNTVFGNVNGFNNAFTWDGKNFSSTLDTTTLDNGTYCFVFNPTDDAGENDVRKTVMFTIDNTIPVVPDVDNTAPVITLIGDAEITMYLNETYTEQGATAMDDIDGDLTSEIITTDNFTNPIDITRYTITYTVTDKAGNTTQTTREVNVLSVPSGGSNPIGLVLGASTENTETTTTEETPKEETPIGEVLGETTCSPSITDYLSSKKKNNPDQVKSLQSFLNLELSLNPALLIDGIFGAKTKKAVATFQEKYAGDVLNPWLPFGLKDATTGTGDVYKTTKWKINSLECPDIQIPFPELP